MESTNPSAGSNSPSDLFEGKQLSGDIAVNTLKITPDDLVQMLQTIEDTKRPSTTRSDKFPNGINQQFLEDYKKIRQQSGYQTIDHQLEQFDKLDYFVDHAQTIDLSVKKPERLRIRLVFKNEILNKYAT